MYLLVSLAAFGGPKPAPRQGGFGGGAPPSDGAGPVRRKTFGRAVRQQAEPYQQTARKNFLDRYVPTCVHTPWINCAQICLTLTSARPYSEIYFPLLFSHVLFLFLESLALTKTFLHLKGGWVVGLGNLFQRD